MKLFIKCLDNTKLKNNKILYNCNQSNNYNLIKYFSTNIQKNDPFLILDISRKSDWKDIKKKYIKLARLYHPDITKNDERSAQKFLQIKEAYEYFERKYNPSKYISSYKQSSSFYQNDFKEYNQSFNNNKSDFDKSFESIRSKKANKNKNFYKSNFNNYNDCKNETNKYDSNFKTNNDKYSNYINDDNKNEHEEILYYLNNKNVRYHNNQQIRINQFLRIAGPNPRSHRMIDRLGLKDITLKSGKIFGPQDYVSFSLFSITLIILLLSAITSSGIQSYEDYQKSYLYAAIRNDLLIKKKCISYDKELTTSEQNYLNTKEFKQYINKSKLSNSNSNKNINNEFIRKFKQVKVEDEFAENL